MFNFDRENTGVIAKWWRNIDKEILFLFISLFLLGLFFSFSSTSSVIAEKLHKETYFLIWFKMPVQNSILIDTKLSKYLGTLPTNYLKEFKKKLQE